ncbi:MAG: hypothetical protein DHS20C16_12540 [Phycisphaerae bacterium]|nr:MAG: hypothetical protein DHS20C16_12540 [Phycisphaerae bacterium]
MNQPSSDCDALWEPRSEEPVRDEGLQCLSCEYNLTGIDSECCPECGSVLDREEIRRIASLRNDQPGSHWERYHGLHKPVGFLITALRAAFLPWRFAQDIPSRPNLKPAIWFALVCVAISIVTGQICDKPDVEGYVTWYAGVVCHILLQTVFLGLLLPPSGLRHGFRFWLAMSLYTSYPLMTEAIDTPPYITSDYSNVWPLSNSEWIPTLHYYVWWIGLILIAHARAHSKRRKWVVLLLIVIPMMTYVSSYAGCQVGELLD